MPTYPVNQNQTIVGQFLRQASLNPPIQNANTRVPDLINCNGVVHYTRSNTRTEITDESFQVERGDFLSVAEVCATGSSQTIVAAIQVSDYAFVMPRDNFGTHAENYMNRRPDTRTIPSSNAINSLDAILNAIISGAQITTPIKDVLIVSHANAGGQLFFKLRNTDQANHMTYNQLRDYLNANHPQITSRQIKDNSNIHIRGCNIGKEPRFLNLVKEAFGNNVTVTAPKHLDRFAFFSSSGTTHRYENMVYHFIIYNKTALANKQAVEDAFVNHTPAFQDIFGNTITRAQFNTWLPQNINAGSVTANHPCTNPIDTGLTVEREFRHQVDNPLYTYNITLDSNPPANQRIDILKQVLANDDTMKSSHPFPMYEQFGYSSLDDFVDNLNWQFNWNNGTKTLNCRGSRHSYQLRIPVTDTNNNLFVNAFLATGAKQFAHNQILETDSRFFGSV